ncbi:hypothetical protein [Anaeromyxobacter terrae]|uniref:hypothetical protein n=1 Tax=Anaeromyxobacter terrae TaxID=2925406 RepID=UPI001F57BF62|nr:hypothetical protein [Anaeromyxobacter sp. SG22]
MSSATAIAALAACCWAVAPRAAGDPGGEVTVATPIPWQEPAPLARLFLQLPFEAPEVVPARQLELELRLLYSNSLLAAENERFTLDIQVETAQPTVILRQGLAQRVEAQLAIPFVVDYGGYLDRPIELVEGLVHASNPQRRGRPRNVARLELARRDGGGLSRSGPGAGLGDVWAGLKVFVAGDGRGGELALRGALKLPTGRLPYGSEELELGASVLAGFRWTSTAVRLQLDLMLPTARLPVVHVKTRPYGAANLGVTRRLGARLALQLQASGHLSPLGGTGLGQLDGSTAYVLGGATVALSSHVDLETGIAENIFSPYRGADITLVAGLRSRL